MMSNCLYLVLSVSRYALGDIAAASSQPTQTQPVSHPLMNALFAVGLCTLAVLIIRAATNPRKLTLQNTSTRPNNLNVFHILLLLLVWFAGQGVADRIGRMWYEPGEGPLEVLAGLAGQTIWVIALPLTASATFRWGLRRGFGLSMRHWVYDTARGIVGYLAVTPICILMLWAVSFLPKEPTHMLLLALGELSVVWKILIVLSAVVLAPLTEEMFFRGLVQSMLRRHLHHPWTCIVITSVGFALVHAPYWSTMPVLFVLSVALGYNYERCGRLYPSILMHAVFNTVNIIVFLTA